MKGPPFASGEVKAAFAAFPEDRRSELLALRALIFEVAADMPEVGPLTETLKWGEPSYVPARPRTGSPLRLGIGKTGQPALYTICQTRLMADFEALFPADFTYEGNRALYLDTHPDACRETLSLLIARALRYHLPQSH